MADGLSLYGDRAIMSFTKMAATPRRNQRAPPGISARKPRGDVTEARPGRRWGKEVGEAAVRAEPGRGGRGAGGSGGRLGLGPPSRRARGRVLGDGGTSGAQSRRLPRELCPFPRARD